jgi:hypothetical protein
LAYFSPEFDPVNDSATLPTAYGARLSEASGGDAMWNLTSEDVHDAKQRATSRRAEIETRYAQELEALKAELSEIETLERIAGEFAQKHKPPEPEPEVLPAVPTAEPVAAGGNREGKLGSRWRFQLSGAGEAEDGHEPAA